jgi:carboxyl-terminal processing protease
MPEENMGEVTPPKSNKYKKILQWAGIALFAAFLFGAGWALGDGRLRIANYASNNSNKSLPADLDYSSVEQVYDLIRENYDGELDEKKLLDGIKAGLAQATGDPYTEYFNEKEAEEFYGDLNGSFTGIGAELGKDEQNNIIIVAPLSGFPAEKAGLKPKDIIAEVDGESTYDWSISQAVSKIRGEKGTTVKLTIVRDGKPQEFEITRDQINIPSVTTKVENGNIGYIKVSRFGDDTTNLVTQAAKDMKSKGIKGIVLDLRGNPGGLLDSSVSVSSIWLGNGKTVLTERRDNKVIETYTSKGESTLQGMPTVVLIDEGSASASEIVAGALKDNGAAKLVGQKTFGKGSVQEPDPLSNGGLVKITIARWYTPGGKNIDKEGIEPDEKVEPTAEDISAGRDPAKDKALQLLNQ